MIVNPEVKERIIAVADQLYSISPGKFPKVAEVRKLAECDMNTAAEVMKIWRMDKLHQQFNAPAISRISVELQQDISKLTEQIWGKLVLQSSTQVRELTEQLNQTQEKLSELQAKHLELENEHRRTLQRERKLSEKIGELQGK